MNRINIKTFFVLLISLFVSHSASASRAWVDGKIDLNVQDVEIHEVMQMLAEMGEVSIITSEVLTGRITLHVTQKSPAIIAALIADLRGFKIQFSEGRYWVLPADQAQGTFIDPAWAPEEKMQIDVQDAEVQDVLKMAAAPTGLDIVISSQVTGRITLKGSFGSVELLNTIARLKHLDLEERSGIILVRPRF